MSEQERLSLWKWLFESVSEMASGPWKDRSAALFVFGWSLLPLTVFIGK